MGSSCTVATVWQAVLLCLTVPTFSTVGIPLCQVVLVFSSAMAKVGGDIKVPNLLSVKFICTFLCTVSMTSQFDTGFPGLKIRECKYYDTHQETHFVCCLEF